MTGVATLTVKLHHLRPTRRWRRPPCRPRSQGAETTPDAVVVWAYPYDGTVWPRGLAPADLQWNGGAADRHLPGAGAEPDVPVRRTTSRPPTRPPSQVPFDPTTWQKLVDSTCGQDARSPSPAGTGRPRPPIATQTWTVAAGVDARHHLLLVQRPRPRAAHQAQGRPPADDFANQAPLERSQTQYTQSSLPDDLPLRQRRRLRPDQRRRHLRRQLRPQGRHADRLPPAARGVSPSGSCVVPW